jgi:hypothetical protein
MTLVQLSLYAVLYAAAALPGLPLGWRLFGRHHPAGWISGALIGYAISAFAIWTAIRAGIPSAVAFVVAWGLLCRVTWYALARRSPPLIQLEPWRRPDTVAYALVMALTILVAAPPLAKIGVRDDQRNRYYRAYFTADFVWHMALTAEIGRFSMPPRNPFLQHQPIHYYWTYFLVPAAVATTGPPVLRDVERCLQLNAFFNGLLFISALFISVRAAVPSSPGTASSIAVGASVALALVASSAEAWDWLRRYPTLSYVREANIDAVTAWEWKGYRVDGLQRAIWYNPQHSMSGALGLVAVTAAAAGGSAASLGVGLLVGIALAGAIMMNPFVGGVFALTYGVAAVVHLIAGRSLGPPAVRRLAYSAAAAVPAVVAVGWCIGNRMVEGAGGALEFGFTGLSRNAPLITLLLSLGPALLPAAAGLFIPGGRPFWRFVPATFLAAFALFLMYFVRLSVDVYWVGFRAGHLMLLSLPALTARFLTWAWESARAIAIAVIIAILAAGIPTFIIDAYNAQDITNELQSVGFPWTRRVSPQEQAVFRWMREQTPREAVIQQDAMSRDSSSWWVVPTFGERRMAAGLPPFLLNVPEYREKSLLVRTMYSTADSREAWTIAQTLQIDYVYIDAVERSHYPEGVGKFDDPRYFERAFGNAAATIYRVR